jgi:hypothetical protein
MPRPRYFVFAALCLWVSACTESKGSSGRLDGGAWSIDGGAWSIDGGAWTMPVLGAVEAIAQVSQDALAAAGRRWTRTLFRNEAYRCGRTGSFTFLLIEREDLSATNAPLWVHLHGGSVGYYDDAQRYHGPEHLNDEESRDTLTGHVSEAVDGEVLRDNAIGRRLADGHRLLVVSMCDHDLYAGAGQVYPNNPHWPDGDRVEGLLATTAAIKYVATTSRDGTHRWPTSRIYLHGSSAGSVGSWNVGLALSRVGVRINGALLDSYVITSRAGALLASRCSPVNNNDPTFDRPSLEAKVGPFLADPALYLENNLPPPFPVLDLEGDMDEWCCGPSPLLPEAAAVGATNNCRWLHEDVTRRMDGLGPTVQSILVPGYGHVIADDPGAHQALVEAWYQATLAQAVAPSFPP